MIFELRIYTMNPGKMDNIKRRFEDKALNLFKKHGMIVLDFWEDLSEEKIYYLMQHDDMEARNRGFEAFMSDPQWHEAKRLSEIDGKLVAKVENYFMKRVPFSPANSEVNP